jgi:hypothetical protein
MPNLVTVAANAVRTAKRSGVAATATITRPAPPPNALTGVQAGSAVPQTVAVIQADAYRTNKKGDAAWSTARVVLFVASEMVAFTPEIGDHCTFAGQKGRITGRDSYAPAGAVIGYFLAVGG